MCARRHRRWAVAHQLVLVGSSPAAGQVGRSAPTTCPLSCTRSGFWPPPAVPPSGSNSSNCLPPSSRTPSATTTRPPPDSSKGPAGHGAIAPKATTHGDNAHAQTCARGPVNGRPAHPPARVLVSSEPSWRGYRIHRGGFFHASGPLIRGPALFIRVPPRGPGAPGPDMRRSPVDHLCKGVSCQTYPFASQVLPTAP